jgi:hypothetical protein
MSNMEFKPAPAGIAPRPNAARPGDEIRRAQHALETQLRDLVAGYNRRYGVTVAGIYIEYVDVPGSDATRDADPVVRIVLET